MLLVHDLEQQQVVACIDLSCSAAAITEPAAAGSRSPAAEEQDAAVSSTCFSPCGPTVAYAACGSAAFMVDLRASAEPQQSFRCKDEIGHLAVNHKGSFLALGDDTGAVQVVGERGPVIRLIRNLQRCASSL